MIQSAVYISGVSQSLVTMLAGFGVATHRQVRGFSTVWHLADRTQSATGV